ncbi:GPI mannosyltransferase 3-like [Argiope bruennichi]|uniref:GPI mannosyltransferase 3-like n=1 Tax=Argiope bruennichi TaxID=94029 RepID=UPI002494C12B|nr:GPI mannosyltransferase 3-like [Argiope bruennichi]
MALKIFNCPDFSILCGILFLRLISVVIVRSSFVPDEYWQSLEVAHKTAFGYGHLTWEWQKKIRSYVYPSIIYILYRIFPESVGTIVFLPKIFQAVLSSIGDFFTYKLSCKLFGSKCGYWTLFNLLTSWFLFYCSSRTLTNMAETSFTSCGLYFYPWNTGKHKGLTCSYLWFAGVSCLIRPTAAILWLPLYLYHLWREKDCICMLGKTLFIGCIILSILLCCDRYFYGEWVLTPYNFFLFNWSNDIGAFYGQHNFLWYFFSGFPVVLGIHLLPFLMGFSLPYLRHFYLLIFWMILVLSLLSHKEFRFLLPILPLSLVICSAVMSEISSKRLSLFKLKINSSINICLVWAIILINIPLSLYMGLIHQSGTIKSTLQLSHILKKNSNVLFLMPCHSTPYYSYIHQNVSMKFLSCEPNFNNVDDYMEEADIFFDNPEFWLFQNYEKNDILIIPSHIVMFDTLFPQISRFLDKYNYSLCYQTFHSHFPESKTGQYVLIYCR